MVVRLSNKFKIDNVLTSSNIGANLPSNVLTTSNIAANLPSSILSSTTTSPSMTGTMIEDVYTITGTVVTLEPDHGSMQVHSLSANTTYFDGFSSGQAITLMIDDGSARTIVWPTMTWVNNGGSAPTLATTGYTVIALWKVSTTLYGALVGDGS